MSFKLAHLLIQEGVISEDALEAIFDRRKSDGDKGLTLDADLCLEGHLTPLQANDYLATAFKLTPVDLGKLQSISSLAMSALEQDDAEEYNVFPYFWDTSADTLHVVSADNVKKSKLRTLAEDLDVEAVVLSLINQVYFEQLRNKHYGTSINPALADLVAKFPLSGNTEPKEPSQVESTPEPEEPKQESAVEAEAAEPAAPEESTPEPVAEAPSEPVTEASDEPSEVPEVAAVVSEDTPVKDEAPAVAEAVEAGTPVVEDSSPAVEETIPAEEPVAEEPTAEEPTAEEPTAEEPATEEEPVVEQPIAAEPVVEEEPQVAAEPAAEEPKQETQAPLDPLASMDAFLDAATADSGFDPLAGLGMDLGSSASSDIDSLLGISKEADPIGSLLSSVSSSSEELPAPQDLQEAVNEVEVTDATSPEPVVETSPQPAPAAAPPAPASGESTFPPQKLSIKLSIDDLDALLQEAKERDTVFKLGLFYIAGMMDQAAIFTMPKKEAKGFMLHGPAELQMVFQHIQISLDSNTIFRKLKDSLVPYAGTLPNTQADRVFFALFDPPPQKVYFFPVRLRGRNVCMLYGHRLDSPISNIEYENLIRSIHLLSQALERVIIARKQGSVQDPEGLTAILETLWNDDSDTFNEQIREFRPDYDDDDFFFEAPVVLNSQDQLVAVAEHLSHAPPAGLAPIEDPPGLETPEEEPESKDEAEVAAYVEVPRTDKEEVSLQTAAATQPVEQEPQPVHVVTAGRSGLAFADADVMSDPELPSQDGGEEESSESKGGGTLDLIPAVPDPEAEAKTMDEAPSVSPEDSAETQGTLDQFPADEVAETHTTEADSVEEETPPTSDDLDAPVEMKDAQEEPSQDEELPPPAPLEEPDNSSSGAIPTPTVLPIATRQIGGEYSNPLVDENGAEISASYIESIPMPDDPFGGLLYHELKTPDTRGYGQKDLDLRPGVADPSDTSEEAANSTVEPQQEAQAEVAVQYGPARPDNVETEEPSDSADSTQAASESTDASAQSEDTEAVVEGPKAPEPQESEEAQASQDSSSANKFPAYEDLKVDRGIILEEEIKMNLFNPPPVESAEALLPLPEDESERQTAMQSLQELSPHDIVVALLHHFPGKLDRNHVQQDGTLLFEVSQTPSGEQWNMLLDYPQEAVIGIQPLLYHETRNVRLMALYMMQQLPFEPLLPHVFRLLLDPDPAISRQAAQLARHSESSQEYQALLMWLRHNLSRATGNQLARSIRILAKLRDALATPELIDLLENEEPGVHQIVHAALIEITKQKLPLAFKKWAKWWRKVGSQTERVDWLIEGIQQKDPEIVNASWLELREITGEDFGFAPDAPRRKRNDAIKMWKRWRKEQY